MVTDSLDGVFEPLTGGCACGAVRYEISEPLVSASYCHCTRCQRRTGAAASPQARPAPGSPRWGSGGGSIGVGAPPGGVSEAVFKSGGGAVSTRGPGGPTQ